MFKMSTHGVSLISHHPIFEPKIKTTDLKIANDSQSQNCDLTLKIDNGPDGVISHETKETLSQNTRYNENSLFPKTGGVKRGKDNQAFSNNDSETEHGAANATHNNSILSQEKMSGPVCKTSLNADETQHAIPGKSNRNEEFLTEKGTVTEDISSVQSAVDEERKDEKGKQIKKREKGSGDGDGVAVNSKEADDIVATETCEDSEEDDLDGEPEDMFYALARSSIDLRINVLKTYKIPKSRKVLVICSCFFMQLCLGMLFSLGILYVELLDAFGANRSVTSLVQSLPLGLAYVLGLVVGPLIQKLGLPVSLFCGGLLSATGFIASYFAKNIYVIIILVGCVTGTGISLFNIGSYAAIPVYFGKQQRIAVAFASFGTGTGAMVWPLINRFLLEHFGWRGNMLITGGILLNVSCLSLLFKPLPLQKKLKETKRSVGTKKTNPSMREKFLQLVKIPMFLVLLMWCIFDGFASPIVGQMIVDFSRLNGYGKDRGAMLLVYFSASNAFGRAMVGIVSRYNISSRLLFVLASSLCGVAFVVLSFTRVYWMTLVVIIFAGFLLGSHVALNMIILLRTVGPDLYALGWGLAATGLGTGFTTSGPIAGYISDMSSYRVSFYVSGFTMIADMTFYGTAYLINRCVKNRSKTA